LFPVRLYVQNLFVHLLFGILLQMEGDAPSPFQTLWLSERRDSAGKNTKETKERLETTQRPKQQSHAPPRSRRLRWNAPTSETMVGRRSRVTDSTMVKSPKHAAVAMIADV